jgi:protein-L-isoaspartate(D-aspartate) O-methyltransferase
MDFGVERAKLVDYLSTKIEDERVLAAMLQVPRELFVPLEEKLLAYEDRPLPIGLGQTISQPYIVAFMTSSLELTGQEKVLELGTGSGYQAAILAELARLVITVERLPQLAESAKVTLDSLGYRNIKVCIAEPALGWPIEAPYEAIMVTAGAPKVPDSLLSQLAIDGRMVIPVGSRYEQDLYKITKLKDRSIIENLGGCRFVSLIGEDAWDEEC